MQQWFATGNIIDGQSDALQTVPSVEAALHLLRAQQPNLQMQYQPHKTSNSCASSTATQPSTQHSHSEQHHTR